MFSKANRKSHKALVKTAAKISRWINTRIHVIVHILLKSAFSNDAAQFMCTNRILAQKQLLLLTPLGKVKLPWCSLPPLSVTDKIFSCFDYEIIQICESVMIEIISIILLAFRRSVNHKNRFFHTKAYNSELLYLINILLNTYFFLSLWKSELF